MNIQSSRIWYCSNW